MGYILLLLAVAMASAETSVPSNAACNAVRQTHLLVSNLLVASGLDETNVAAALETCVPAKPSRALNCKDLLDAGDSGKGIRHVYPYPAEPNRRVQVYCDHTIDEGGWTVLQRRTEDAEREYFNKTMADYKLGFGKLQGEFWLGLDKIHQLTSVTLMQLRIDLADFEGGERVAKYDYFYVGPQSDDYRLNVGTYTGDAGDALNHHSGQRFSTYDVDNDGSSTINCAEERGGGGGWWFKECVACNLNGFQYKGTDSPSGFQGIRWDTWHGHDYSLRGAAIMIKPAE